jgi:hypothetical protein
MRKRVSTREKNDRGDLVVFLSMFVDEDAVCGVEMDGIVQTVGRDQRIVASSVEVSEI